MLNLNFNDPAVLAAMIQSLGAVITGICAAIIGKQITGRKHLQDKLREACADIAFLMAVEEEHGRLHSQHSGRTFKMSVRREVQDRGLTWSGKYTPGRVKASLGDGFSMSRALFAKAWALIPSRPKPAAAAQNAPQ